MVHCVSGESTMADPPDASLPSSSRGVYWDLVEKIKIAPTAESKYEEIFSAHDLQWEQYSSTFSRERQLLIPKQENFSINCCTELFTQIRFFIKWAWYRHLCVPFVEIWRNLSSICLFIAISQNISGHH